MNFVVKRIRHCVVRETDVLCGDQKECQYILQNLIFSHPKILINRIFSSDSKGERFQRN